MTARAVTDTEVGTGPRRRRELLYSEALSLRAQELATGLLIEADLEHHPINDPHQPVPPPAVNRWLSHAIASGTPAYTTAQFTMSGAIRLGHHWHDIVANEILVPHLGFVWGGRTHAAGITVQGYDSFYGGRGEAHWHMFGALPLPAGSEFDVTRSAAGRLAAEAVMLPSAMTSLQWRSGPVDNSAVYLHRIPGQQRRQRVTIHVAADGRLERVTMLRWGQPNSRRRAYATQLFDMRFADELTISGLTIAKRLTAAWYSPTGERRDFFRARIDEATFD